VINGVLPCGQSAGLIDEVERAGDVVTNIAARRRRFCRVWRSADIEEAARQG
jgi:hypothetical protein